MSSGKSAAKWSAGMNESGPSGRSNKELGFARSLCVADFLRIDLMPPSELLDLAWSYPLFEALYGRRSRRFGGRRVLRTCALGSADTASDALPSSQRPH